MVVADHVGEALALELSAVVVTVTEDQPRVLVLEDGPALPSGPLEEGHRTLELGLRAWVEERTRLPLGYVEQLYTFADRGRAGAPSARVISLSYLALTREPRAAMLPGAAWHNWYRHFPWEDWRGGANALVALTIVPALESWAGEAAGTVQRERRRRIAVTFGADERSWDEELVLQRFELLYEARLVPEAWRGSDGKPAALVPGEPLALDHRRILATGIARLRAKIKYRPVVFELMPDNFTLLHLQRAVEALAGRRLHKQNFRRFVEGGQLVEETGTYAEATGGRPAKLMRFRREVLLARAVSGTKLPLSRPG